MYWDYDYFHPSKPRAVKGGIKMQSQSKNWWVRRWLEVLENHSLGDRLSRGRSYARRGQVLSIDIEPGEVLAKVQGSRPKPYRVKMTVKTLSLEKWRKWGRVFSQQPILATKLLAGEMPDNIEDAFRNAGILLFPKHGDLKTECTCPDSTNPCKHIAAVYYLLGEEFDRDPFLIFKLWGLNKEALVGLSGGVACRVQKGQWSQAKGAGEEDPVHEGDGYGRGHLPIPKRG